MPQQVTGYGPTFPGSKTSFLDSLGAYNASRGQNRQLDQCRLFARVNPGYFHKGYVFPRPEFAVVGSLATVEDTITIPPNSYLLYITGGIGTEDADAGAGFDFQIYDKGANAYLGLNDLNFWRTTTGDMRETVPGVDGEPTGPWFLTAPYCVTPPGQLNLSLTNLATTEVFMQMLLLFAVPVTPQSRAAVGLSRARVTLGENNE